MFLGSILSDIEEDTLNISTESSGIDVKNITDFNINNAVDTKIDQNVIDKVHQYNILNLYRKHILSAEKLDRSVAYEVFTMLPNVSNVDKAKLTSTPSLINKEIVTNILDRNNWVDYDLALKSVTMAITDSISDVSKKVEFILAFLDNFYNDIDKDYKRLCAVNPIIIYRGESVNLLTANMTYISGMNTNLIDYNKYVDTLDSKYFALCSNLDSLLEICTHIFVLCRIKVDKSQTTLEDLQGDNSLKALVDLVLKLRTRVSDKMTFLNRLKEPLSQKNNEYIFNTDISISIAALNNLHKLVLSENTPFNNIKNILSFLD
jgi:hypothetical protein